MAKAKVAKAKTKKEAKKAGAAAKIGASAGIAGAITENSIIGETVNKHPQTVPVFFRHGLMCIGCGFAMMETIGQGAMGHGIPLEPLLKDLNAALAAKKKK